MPDSRSSTREQKAASIARRRAAARTAGLCITCCKAPPPQGYNVCAPCRETAHRRTLLRRERIRTTQSHPTLAPQTLLEERERAGDVVWQRRFFEGAAQFYQEALQLPNTTPEITARLCEKIAYSLGYAGHSHEAVQWFERAAQENIARGCPLQAAHLLLDSNVYTQREQSTVISTNVQKAIALSEKLNNPVLSKKALALMILALFNLGKHQAAEPYVAQARGIGPVEDAYVELVAHSVFGYYEAYYGHRRDAYECMENAIEHTAKTTPQRAQNAWRIYARIALMFGDIEKAKSCAENALFLSRQSKVSTVHADNCLLYADILRKINQVSAARNYVLEAITMVPHDFQILEVGGLVALDLQDETLLLQCSQPEAVARAFRSNIPNTIKRTATVLARVYVLQHRERKAKNLLHRALVATALQLIDQYSDYEFLMTLAEHGFWQDIPNARELLAARARFPDGELARAYLDFFDAHVAQRSSKLSEARVFAHKAAQQFRDLHWYAEAANAQALDPHNTESYATTPASELLHINLHSTLTSREREVAELVVKGMSNRNIATALSITERTVEAHISAIMGRLGIRSRHQISGAFDPL